MPAPWDYLGIRDRGEAVLLGGASGAVAAAAVLVSDLPEGLEPVGVATTAAIVFLSLVFTLTLARL